MKNIELLTNKKNIGNLEQLQTNSPNIVGAINENKEAIDEVRTSLEGYATETFVADKIAEAQLNNNGNINLETLATKEELSGKVDVSTYNSHVGNTTAHITQAERDIWNEKETTNGAQSKANAALASAKTYVDEKFDVLFQNVSNGKTLIASAITDKGVDASEDETFQSLSDKIALIPSGPPGSNIIGYINEENDIYVSLTELESGTYTLKLEDYDGILEDFDDIGTVEVK